MDDAELDALERLAAEATSGEWQAGIAGHCNLVTFDGEDIIGLAVVGNRRNAAFIARARTAVPELVAEVRRLRSKLEYWTLHRRIPPEPEVGGDG